MGDDLLDIAVLNRVGLAGAPADAAAEARDVAHWVSAHGGGRGAVREFIELILRAQGHWDAIVKDFSA
jgi:3-deoxy-D-manno-octulosonate 8-phosphate phosphatase (KDO 8-P phosphatase)